MKPKSTGMGSLSFHQWIFMSQESNQGLLHYRQILYQLSYQGIAILMIIDLNVQSDNSNIPAVSGSDVYSVSSDSLLICLVIFCWDPAMIYCVNRALVIQEWDLMGVQVSYSPLTKFQPSVSLYFLAVYFASVFQFFSPSFGGTGWLEWSEELVFFFPRSVRHLQYPSRLGFGYILNSFPWGKTLLRRT